MMILTMIIIYWLGKQKLSMEGMEGPSENIKEGVVKINREKTKQFMTEVFPCFFLGCKANAKV